MKKQILNIGKALNRAEQKEIFGGNVLMEEGFDDGCYVRGEMDNNCGCNYNSDCKSGYCEGRIIGLCKDKPA